MDLRQASLYLGVSPDTLYRYVNEGVVPAFKLGNRWKLRKAVLDSWMEREIIELHRNAEHAEHAARPRARASRTKRRNGSKS
jgi:excisionase family DNA binding protein